MCVAVSISIFLVFFSPVTFDHSNNIFPHRIGPKSMDKERKQKRKKKTKNTEKEKKRIEKLKTNVKIFASLF